jgi:hypothetical protein
MQQQVILVLIGVAVAAAVYLWGRHRVSPDHPVGLEDIPLIFERLVQAKRDGSFAVLLFGRDGGAPAKDGALNVQFSLEEGRVGLDWVLLAPLNVRARKNVAAFLRRNGRTLRRLEGNGVKYLRTEDGDLVRLCQNLLQKQFGATATQRLTLKTPTPAVCSMARHPVRSPRASILAAMEGSRETAGILALPQQ